MIHFCLRLSIICLYIIPIFYTGFVLSFNAFEFNQRITCVFFLRSILNLTLPGVNDANAKTIRKLRKAAKIAKNKKKRTREKRHKKRETLEEAAERGEEKKNENGKKPSNTNENRQKQNK